ncbi:hypothetical protein J6590_015120 [Homalodisca vitripennis]|nr:hypothetical protein J6590_015120 [Homalodisca vitripennis]
MSNARSTTRNSYQRVIYWADSERYTDSRENYRAVGWGERAAADDIDNSYKIYNRFSKTFKPYNESVVPDYVTSRLMCDVALSGHFHLGIITLLICPSLALALYYRQRQPTSVGSTSTL